MENIHDLNALKNKQLIKKYEDVINSLNENINRELGRDLTAKEAFGLFANSVGLNLAKNHFILFKEAFKNSNISHFNEEDWSEINTKYNMQFTTKVMKENNHTINKKIFFDNLKTNEVIILSVIFGIVVGLIFGYIFGENQFYYKGKRINPENSEDYSVLTIFKFNYLLFFCSFIISSGLCYLYFIKKNNDEN